MSAVLRGEVARHIFSVGWRWSGVIFSFSVTVHVSCLPMMIRIVLVALVLVGCGNAKGERVSLDAGGHDARAADARPMDSGASDAGAVADGAVGDAGAVADAAVADAALADSRVDWPEGCGGHEGPLPVAVHFDRDGGVVDFCIDSTEVTVGQYARFYADADASMLAKSAACGWKTGFNGGIEASSDFPVRNVDWCDAYAYCSWAGKHLCGNINGGPLVAATDPTLDGSFIAACTNDGVQSYPYGTSYDSAACVTDRTVEEGVAPVGSRPECEVNGVYDLVGNVWEYIDSCQTESETGSRDTQCVFVGGPYGSAGPTYNCYSGTTWRREDFDRDVGFRCCSSMVR